MDWDQEILKLIRAMNPQTIVIVGVLTEGIKRSIWRSLAWSKSYLWLVPMCLAFPTTYLFALQESMSWQILIKNSLLTGCLMILVYDRILQPILEKYFPNGG